MINIFFRLMLFLFISFSVQVTFINQSQAQVAPWPWGSELPFPWDEIEGIWSGSVDGQSLVFSFEVIQQKGSSERQIKVKQLSPNRGEIISTGWGKENNRVVVAVMTGGRNTRYMLTVRLVKDNYCLEHKPRTVVTIQNMRYDDFVYLIAIEKISNTPLTQATQFNYNDFLFLKELKMQEANPYCFF